MKGLIIFMAKKGRPRKNNPVVRAEINRKTVRDLDWLRNAKGVTDGIFSIINELNAHGDKYNIDRYEYCDEVKAYGYVSDSWRLAPGSEPTSFQYEPGEPYATCFYFCARMLTSLASESVLRFFDMMVSGDICVFVNEYFGNDDKFKIYLYPNKNTIVNLNKIEDFRCKKLPVIFISKDRIGKWHMPDRIFAEPMFGQEIAFPISYIYSSLYGDDAYAKDLFGIVSRFSSIECLRSREEAGLYEEYCDDPFSYKKGRGTTTFRFSSTGRIFPVHCLTTEEHINVYTFAEIHTYALFVENRDIRRQSFQRLFDDFGGRFVSLRFVSGDSVRVMAMSGDLTDSYDYMDQHFYGKGAAFEHVIYANESVATYNANMFKKAIPVGDETESDDRQSRRLLYEYTATRDHVYNIPGSTNSYVFNFYVDRKNHLLRFLHPVYIPYVDYTDINTYNGVSMNGASAEAVMFFVQKLYMEFMEKCLVRNETSMERSGPPIGVSLASIIGEYALYCKVEDIIPRPRYCVIGIGSPSDCDDLVQKAVGYEDHDANDLSSPDAVAFYEWNPHYHGVAIIDVMNYMASLSKIIGTTETFGIDSVEFNCNDFDFNLSDSDYAYLSNHGSIRRRTDVIDVHTYMVRAFQIIWSAVVSRMKEHIESNTTMATTGASKDFLSDIFSQATRSAVSQRPAKIMGTHSDKAEDCRDLLNDDRGSDIQREVISQANGNVAMKDESTERKSTGCEVLRGNDVNNLSEVGKMLFPKGFNLDFADMCKYMMSRIIGHDDAVRTACYYIWRYVRSLAYDDVVVRDNFIIAGSSGCGKTEFLKALRDYLSMHSLGEFVPVDRVDTASLTPPGYKGVNLDEAMCRIYAKGQDTGGAGIVFFDEFDKRICPVSGAGSEKMWATKGVSYAMLSVVEGSKGVAYASSAQGSVSFPYDTSRTLFIGMGAFDDYRNRRELEHEQSIGFVSAHDESFVAGYWQDVTKDGLMKDGAREELLGRFVDVVNFRRLDESALKQILYKNINELYCNRRSSLIHSLKLSDEAESMLIKEGQGKRGARDMISMLEIIMNRCLINIIESGDADNVSSVTILDKDHVRVNRFRSRKNLDI